jgi:hypothetical protein
MRARTDRAHFFRGAVKAPDTVCRGACAVVAITFIVGCGGGTSGAAPQTTSLPITSPPSVSTLPVVGTTWTYDQNVMASPSGPRDGTLSIVYQGQTGYRGGSYYTIQTTSVEAPPVLTSYFSVPATGPIEEYAGAFYNFPIAPGCLQSPQQEDVLAVPVAFTSVQSVNVEETSYRCGFQPVTSSSTLVTTDGGTASVAIAGQPMTLRVVHGTFTTFGQMRSFTDYLAGSTVLRRDVTYSDANGATQAQATVTYESGPLDVVFPGPPMLLSQDF